MPTGGAIVLCASSVFVVSMLVAPNRGLLASALRLTRLRIRIGREHALRSAFEWLEERGVEPSAGARVPLSEALRAVEDWPLWRRLVVSSLRTRSLGRIEGDDLVIDARGAQEAARITRAHRLWEAYLQQHADVAPTHAHSPADLVEHSLGPEIIQELERVLHERARPAPRASAAGATSS